MESDIGDLEFKPLNEGLGFHRKVKPLETESDADEAFSFSPIGSGTLDTVSREQSKGLLGESKPKHNSKSVSDLIASLPPSLDLLIDETTEKNLATPSSTHSSMNSNIKKKKPLFGPITASAPGETTDLGAGHPVSEKSVSLKEKKNFLNLPLGRADYGLRVKPGEPAPALDESMAKAFPAAFPHLGSLAGQPAARSLNQLTGQGAAIGQQVSTETAKSFELTTGEKAISSSFGSAILDTLVAIGASCLFLSIALWITGANLIALLENSQTDQEIMISLGIFFVGISLLYVLAARTWVGATLGEWSYEVRVGSVKSRGRWYYPILVLWRSLIVAATGFVVMPLLSIIVGRDVLKYLTGLELVSVESTPEFQQSTQTNAEAGYVKKEVFP